MDSAGFELGAGAICLDLVNTIDGRPTDHARDRLQSYADLVSWAVQGNLISRSQADRLLREAAAHPAAATAALRRARAVREDLFSIVSSVAAGERIPRDRWTRFNDALARALSHSRIAGDDRGFTWTWVDTDSLDRVLWPAVRSAADLLTSPDLSRVRVCAADSCDWLFVDRTKNAARRWCDMRVCGNRAKVKEYYRRKKAGGP